MYRVGMDIGGTKIDAVLLDGDGSVVGRVRSATVRGADNVLAGALSAVEALKSGRGGAVGSVGVGIPGAVDSDTGRVFHAVNLGVTELDLGAELSRRLSVPVHVENDVNAAALGVWHSLGGRKEPVESLAYLNLGTGLAAGLVLGGRVWRGSSGLAGEIGHLPFRADGEPCVCGQRGCLEMFASGSAIARRWPSVGSPPMVSLLDAAERGEQRAAQILDDFTNAVATVLRTLALSIDPEVIVIGGGLSLVGERLLRIVRDGIDSSTDGVPFLASARLTDRVSLLSGTEPVAAIGAALAV